VGRGWARLKLFVSGPDLQGSGLRRGVQFVVKISGFCRVLLVYSRDER